MFKKLNISEIEEIYNTYMVSDFPENELKPLSHIKRMVTDKVCTCYALYEGNIVLSYAFLCEYDGYVLIDYLAVNPRFRGKGIGTKTLEFLKDKLGGKHILVECEDIAFSVDESEKTIRQRRIAFYENSGFILSQVKTNLFGVRYVILTYPKDDADILNGFKNVYSRMLSKESFSKNLCVFSE